MQVHLLAGLGSLETVRACKFIGIAALILRPVKRHVGHADQIFLTCAGLWRAGNADADTDVDLLPSTNVYRLGNRPADFLGQCCKPDPVCMFGEEDNEFVSSNPADDTIVADQKPHSVGNSADDPVTGFMPVCVVHRFEAVEITGKYRKSTIRQAIQRESEAVGKMMPVRPALSERRVARSGGSSVRFLQAMPRDG